MISSEKNETKLSVKCVRFSVRMMSLVRWLYYRGDRKRGLTAVVGSVVVLSVNQCTLFTLTEAYRGSLNRQRGVEPLEWRLKCA